MQFIVTGYDGKDEGALDRRMSAREQHLQTTSRMKAEGKTVFAAALTDDNGKMIGSVLMLDVVSREELDKWLEVEPYVINNVWQSIDVKPIKIAAIFDK